MIFLQATICSDDLHCQSCGTGPIIAEVFQELGFFIRITVKLDLEPFEEATLEDDQICHVILVD